MVRPVSIGRAVSRLHRWLFVSGHVARVAGHRQLSILAAAFLVSWLVMTPFVATANAVEANVSNDNFSALRDYAQLIDTERKPASALDQNSNDATPKESTDATIEALHEFAQRISSDQLEPINGLPKLVDADTASRQIGARARSPDISRPSVRTSARRGPRL